MKKQFLVFMMLLNCALINACAFNLQYIPAQIDRTQSTKSPFELLKEVDVHLDTGYSRKLKAGTKWNYVGSVSYGDVYRTNDQVLTVEGSHIFEAYIVIANENLVGFYLPVESAYSPLNNGNGIPIEKKVFNP